MKMDVVRFLVSVALAVLFCEGAPEPMCSKFTFEEQLLDKLVRMEFRMEIMEKEIVQMETEANDKINTLKIDWAKNELEAEVKLKRLEEMISVLSVKNEELDRNLSSIAQIKEIKTDEPTIAFHAHLVTNKLPKKNEVFVFQTVMMNEGDAYDSSNGYFTAPVDGIYHFTSHLCVEAATPLTYVIIVKNKRWASGYYEEQARTGTCASVSVTTKVQKGQRVWVTQDEISNPSKLLYEDDDDWNHFSGFLVKQL